MFFLHSSPTESSSFIDLCTYLLLLHLQLLLLLFNLNPTPPSPPPTATSPIPPHRLCLPPVRRCCQLVLEAFHCCSTTPPDIVHFCDEHVDDEVGDDDADDDQAGDDERDLAEGDCADDVKSHCGQQLPL